MKNTLTILSLLFLPLLISCTKQETLDRAFSLGAHTTVQLFVKECHDRYSDIQAATQQVNILTDRGLAENHQYFIQIDDKEWIEEAHQIAITSLKKASPTMTQKKCEYMLDEVIKDGGVTRSINDYYPKV